MTSTTTNRTSSSRRVVVTGLGATTPLGGDVRTSWEAALAGRSGARSITDPWIEEFELPVTFAAQAAVRADSILERREIKRLDPSQQFAVIAAREAWADAGSPEVDPERLGVAIGTGIGGVWTLLDQWDILREKGLRRVFPLAVPMLMPNAAVAAVTKDFEDRPGAAVVAGGSGGLGAAVCRLLAERGSDVALTYHRNATAAAAVTTDVEALGLSGFAASAAADLAGAADDAEALDALALLHRLAAVGGER